MRNSSNYARYAIIFLLPILLFACDRNNGFVPTSLPPVAKITVPNFYTTHSSNAEVEAYLENMDIASRFIIDYGFLVHDQPFEGFEADRKVSLGADFGNHEKYATTIDNLSKEFYYIRAYVSYEDDENYFSAQSVINTKPGTWTAKAAFPGDAKIGATSFVIGDKAYIAGGKSDELWSYNPATDLWEQKAPTPKALENPVSFVINDKAYVGCNLFGENSDRLDDFWQYDPARDQWKLVASPSEFKGSMVENPFAFSMGRFGYIECNYNLLLQYDPIADRWHYVQSDEYFEFDREDAVALAKDDVAIVTGGHNVLGEYLGDVQVFSGTQSAWERKEELPVNRHIDTQNGRTGALGFVLNNRFYMGMGEAENNLSHTDLMVYDNTNDMWIANEVIPAPDFGNFGIQQGVGFAVNGKGYIGLGRRNWRAGVEDFSMVNFQLWEFTPDQ